MAGFQEIQIQKVVACGFKGFAEEVVFDFEPGTNVYGGDNGKGKSSIGDVVVWLLTGKSILGKQKDLNILNKESRVAVASMTFLDEAGDTHKIERKLNSTMTVKLDGQRINQDQLESKVPTKLFLMIFNPLYFLSLDADSSRNAVFSLIPETTKDEVLLGLDKGAVEFLSREAFEMTDTNEYLKSRRQELKNLEDKKKHIKGYMAKLEEPIVIPPEVVFDESQLQTVEQQLSALSERKPTLVNLSDMLLKKSALEKTLSEVSATTFVGATRKVQLQGEQVMLQEKIKTVQERTYKPIDVAPLETEIAVLRTDYRNVLQTSKKTEQDILKVQEQKIHFHVGDSCPSCKQTITEKAVKVLNAELQRKVADETTKLQDEQKSNQKTLAELESDGKKLLEQITASKKQDDELRQKFEAEKTQEIATLQAKIDAVNAELIQLAQDETNFTKEKQVKMGKISKDITALGVDQLEAENKKVQKAFDEEIAKERSTLQSSLNLLKKQQREAIENQTRRQSLQKQLESNQKELEAKQEELRACEAEETKIQERISFMKVFNSQKISVLNGKVSKFLTSVELRLEKNIQSTGEVRECFDILYMGKELNVCSTSETIKAGLEIAHMVSELSGLSYPVFVDNGESITSYDHWAKQIIETRVVKGETLAILHASDEQETPASDTPSSTNEIIEEMAG